MVWPDLILISSSQRKKCDFTASSQRKTGFLASLQRKTWFTASSQRGYSAKRGLQRVHRAKARISIRYRSWDWPDILFKKKYYSSDIDRILKTGSILDPD